MDCQVHTFVLQLSYFAGNLLQQVTMVLAIINNHISCYHTHTHQPTYFLSPDIINPTECSVYYYGNSSAGAVGYMLLHIPCTRLVLEISFVNPALSYVMTGYLAL